MFAALMVVRLREACLAAKLTDRVSWTGPDDFCAKELPLAKATEKVLASMQMVLEKTLGARDEELAALMGRGKEMAVFGGVDVAGYGGESDDDDDDDDGNGGEEGKSRHLAETKAAEVRVVRNVGDLWAPEDR